MSRIDEIFSALVAGRRRLNLCDLKPIELEAYFDDLWRMAAVACERRRELFGRSADPRPPRMPPGPESSQYDGVDDEPSAAAANPENGKRFLAGIERTVGRM